MVFLHCKLFLRFANRFAVKTQISVRRAFWFVENRYLAVKRFILCDIFYHCQVQTRKNTAKHVAQVRDIEYMRLVSRISNEISLQSMGNAHNLNGKESKFLEIFLFVSSIAVSFLIFIRIRRIQTERYTAKMEMRTFGCAQHMHAPKVSFLLSNERPDVSKPKRE